MQLVEKHVISQADQRYAVLDAACFASKNLSNAALYELRQTFFATNTSPSYPALDKRMQEHEAYRAFPAKVAQQVLKQVSTAWSSFWAATNYNRVRKHSTLGYLSPVQFELVKS